MPLIDKLRAELRGYEESRRFRRMEPAARNAAGRVSVRGKEYVDLTSWDVFDLAHNPRVLAAAQESMRTDGFAGHAARVSSGTNAHHMMLEGRLAKFLGTESAILFPNLNQAVLSLLCALLAERDVVFVDELLQSPMSDAALLAHATVVPFRSDTPNTLERALASSTGIGERLVVTEGLSPVTGSITDVSLVARICAAAAVPLIVDESTAFGLIGDRGAGACEHFRLGEEVFCRVGDLSRAAGSFGAFIAGSAVVCGYVLQRSRSLAVETASPPPLARAAAVALDAMELSTFARVKCHSYATKVHSTLLSLGIPTTKFVSAPIVSIEGDKARAIQYGLAEHGFLAELLPPLLPRQGASVRLIFSCGVTDSDIERLQNALLTLWNKLGRA